MATAPIRRNTMLNRTSGTMSDLPPRQSVAVIIDQYVLVDKKKSTPGSKEAPNGDYAECFLLHHVPAWDLKANFTPGATPEDAEIPSTRIKVMMPMPGNGQGARRRDLFGLSKSKGSGEAMDPGSIVIFQKAWFDKRSGMIKAHYSKGAASKNKLEGMLKVVFYDMLVCVRPEDYNKTGPRAGWAGRVDVLIADPKTAEVVTTKDELKARLAELVAHSAIGSPGFQLLARQLAPEGVDAVAFASNPETRVGGLAVARRAMYVEVDGALQPKPEDVSKDDPRVSWHSESDDQLLARFERDNPGLTDLIENSEWQVEFMPMMAVNQAKSLVPSLAEEAGDPVRDMSKIYGIYGEIPAGPDGEFARELVQAADGKSYGMIDNGWTPSHVICERKEADSPVWYSTFQSPMGEKLDADSIHDNRTPLTPSYHLEAIKATAAVNLEGKRAHRAAAKTSEEIPEENIEEGQEAAPTPGM